MYMRNSQCRVLIAQQRKRVVKIKARNMTFPELMSITDWLAAGKWSTDLLKESRVTMFERQVKSVQTKAAFFYDKFSNLQIILLSFLMQYKYSSSFVQLDGPFLVNCFFCFASHPITKSFEFFHFPFVYSSFSCISSISGTRKLSC